MVAALIGLTTITLNIVPARADYDFIVDTPVFVYTRIYNEDFENGTADIQQRINGENWDHRIQVNCYNGTYRSNFDGTWESWKDVANTTESKERMFIYLCTAPDTPKSTTPTIPVKVSKPVKKGGPKPGSPEWIEQLQDVK